MADVTGHAMDAAIPVVMFSGILRKQMEFGGSMSTIFEGLNRSMCEVLDDRTFVCFMMGQVDLSTRTFSMSNGGRPYPYHFQVESGEMVELENGVYPLGVRPDTEYQVLETQLQSGDRIVFCSDGIIEAEDGEGNLFGFERTSETICHACKDGPYRQRRPSITFWMP